MSSLCRHRRCSYGLQHLHQLIQFRGVEQAIRSARRDVGERGFIESFYGDNSVLREVIDDEVHELDLVIRLGYSAIAQSLIARGVGKIARGVRA